jgi:hypothetical protein
VTTADFQLSKLHFLLFESKKMLFLTAQGEETGFADKEDISSWAKEAVAAVVAERIMNGYQDNTIRPQGKASRAEAATVIIKILNR